jgi:Ni/Co efflux regulator RcnB
MKKLILAAIAASLVSAPAFAAGQQWDRHDNGQHRGWDRGEHRGDQRVYRDWHRGDRFDYRYARNYRELSYRDYRGLRRPPRGYHWVRSGDDALLVGITSGVIASIVAGAVR